MEQNIADLLKDAISDFEHPQSDEETSTSYTELDIDEDMDDVNGAGKLQTASEQASVETFTNVNDQEESEASSDNGESESCNSFSINTESTFCLPHEIENDQLVNTLTTEEQQLNYITDEFTEKEGNMQSDFATAGVTTHGLDTGFSIKRDEQFTEEERIESFNIEYKPQTSPAMSNESQTPEETSSESEEVLPENYSSTEQTSQCESVDNKDDNCPAMNPNIADKFDVRDDLKEFTEEDQEQIEESLADYPSDFSPSETEEPGENATAQTFTLININSSNDDSTNRMEDLFNAENVNLQNKDNPASYDNSVIKDLEVEMRSDLTFQRENFDDDDDDDDDVQEYLTNDRKTEEDAKINEDDDDDDDDDVQEYLTNDRKTEEDAKINEDDDDDDDDDVQEYLTNDRKTEEDAKINEDDDDDDVQEYLTNDRKTEEDAKINEDDDDDDDDVQEYLTNDRKTEEDAKINEDDDDDDDDDVQEYLTNDRKTEEDAKINEDDDDDDDDDVQEYLTNDRKTEEDAKINEDAGKVIDVNDEAGYNSDSSSDDDDDSTSQEETELLSTVNQEEEQNYAARDNYPKENLVRMDNDIGDICPDTVDRDPNSPGKQEAGHLFFCDVEEIGPTNTSSTEDPITENTEIHQRVESVQSNKAIKDDDKYSTEASDNAGDTKNIIPEVLWSSSLLMDEDTLCLDDYDWDLTGEDSFKINSCEGEDQEYTEKALGESDVNNGEEGNDRDWELEKTRIEAFYRFYGDKTEAEDEVGRNHKVTFCLDNESSEYDEDSESTEEELDSDLNTPDLNTLKPEYNSESDDLLEKPYYPERSRMQPKEQQPVNAAVKHPHRNKCFAVLKSILAFGLLTAIGVVSFWWATENLDWIP